MITLTLPDNSRKRFKKGSTPLNLAASISEGLMRATIAAKVDGILVDATLPLEKDCRIQLITFKDREGVDVFRHSSAHLLAQAVVELFPEAKVTIGPAVEDGFYYDIDHSPFSENDMKKIEERMKEIVIRKLPITWKEMPKEEAKKLFKDNRYKVELINEMKEKVVRVYTQGDFFDLCRGPHVPNTSYIKAVKVTKIAGAYWHGDAKNKQLQRIYGISFPDKKMLKDYLHLLEEALKRDHRTIGKEQDLFSLRPEGPGFPFFHPKGMVIFNELLQFWREEHRKAGYVEVKTPIILNKALWEISGHKDNYKENMYTTKIDKQNFAIKPMNCPGGMLLYKRKLHSYRDLPIRAGEIGLVHRHELSGVLAGLFRVRAFHQDDAHIFMTENQIKDEVLGVIELADRFYKLFGLTYHMELSTRPEKSIGTDEQWEKATRGLENALKELKKEYTINKGEGAFYGPKIDLHIKDCLGRTWQCGTIQLDMSLPERFDLTYEEKDGKKHRVVMIHRVIYGSLERFIGILIEHYAGKFPLWLSPVQVRLLPLADRFNAYTESACKDLCNEMIRAETDTRSESLNKKIRDAQLDQVNYILVVGEKEQKDGTVNIRTRDGNVHGTVSLKKFLDTIKEEIRERR